MENQTSISFKNAFLGINKKKKEETHIKNEFLIVKIEKNYKNIKKNMIKWLLTDMGDNLIMFDFLLISFNHILNLLPNRKIITSRKVFFTTYINWIYKYSSANKFS